MTSLIWGAGYLVHGGIVKHRREKQRVKNYERWEDLRDEYDEMKKTQRLSSDFEREDQSSRRSSGQYDRPILTLRDQQEAGDSRTSWRPQESWEGPKNTSQSSRAPSTLRAQKTGATWDEGLPQPLNVTRRNWDEEARSSSETHSAAAMSREPSASRTGREERRTSPHSNARRSTSAESEKERKKYDVEVVESPFEWWKQ